MARYERKFVIGVEDFVKLERRLPLILEKDSHCADGPYFIRSLYFDSFDNKAAYDVLAGSLNKQKVRLRTYDPQQGPYKLEYKCKTDELGEKRSLLVTRPEAEELVMGRFDFLADKHEPLAAELYARMKIDCARPVSIVDYRRIAYVSPTFDTRVTFDMDVCGNLATRGFFDPDMSGTPLTRPSIGVLELKYNGVLMSNIKEIVKDVEAVSQSNSKYLQSRLWAY